MDTPVTVVVIESLSYTGTTWLNYVLGSHDDIFCLGPADRPFALPRDQAATACRVHGENCSFWPRFYQTWDADENFFVHLAQVSGKRIIVTNNLLPTGAGAALNDSRIVVRPIRFIRDGRAVAESFARKHPDQAFFDIVRDWLAPSFNNFAFDPANPDSLCLRYEDVLKDQAGMLEHVGRFLGLTYDPTALRFWEHEHHPAAGNAGPIMMIRMHQENALPLPGSGRDKAFYIEQYQKTIENPNHRFESHSWADRLSSRERFIFDVIAGKKNESLGYERDRFTLDEVRTFSEEFDRTMNVIDDDTFSDSTPAVEEAVEVSPVAHVPSPAPTPIVLPPHEPAKREHPSSTPPEPRSGGTVVAVTLAAILLGVVSLLSASGVL